MMAPAMTQKMKIPADERSPEGSPTTSTAISTAAATISNAETAATAATLHGGDGRSNMAPMIVTWDFLPSKKRE